MKNLFCRSLSSDKRQEEEIESAGQDNDYSAHLRADRIGEQPHEEGDDCSANHTGYHQSRYLVGFVRSFLNGHAKDDREDVGYREANDPEQGKNHPFLTHKEQGKQCDDSHGYVPLKKGCRSVFGQEESSQESPQRPEGKIDAWSIACFYGV